MNDWRTNMNIDEILKLKEHRKIILTIKIFFCVLIVAWFGNCLFVKGIESYYSYKDYTYQNEIIDPISESEIMSVNQKFFSQGNILSGITLYFGDLSNFDITIALLDENGKCITSKVINPQNYSPNAWNTISLDCIKVKRNKWYDLYLEGENLSSIVLNNGNSNTKIFSTCMVDGNKTVNTLACGFQSTYRYMLLGYRLQLYISVLIALVLGLIFCFSVINFEMLYFAFSCTEQKKGFWYAVFFSVYTVMMFNPLETVRNEAEKFDRVIGAGLNAGIDVSKRVSNFSCWFIFLTILFVMYYLLANYLKGKEYKDENKKIISFLDNMIVIANVILGLRCITYFNSQLQDINIFYYTDYFLALVLCITTGYVLFSLGNKISVDKYVAINISAWLLCLPIAIVVTHEWDLGRKFIGLQYISSVLIFFWIALSDNNRARLDNISLVLLVTGFSFIPFITSLYIEMVTILNQRKIFLTHIRSGYCFAILFLILVVSVLTISKKKSDVKNWKKIVYPILVFGFSCLWQQIAISREYGAHLYETANSSVLINDFLQFGDIPIIQHYGGHMMSSVWEGIIYAVINNDYTGAVLSPYAGYIAVLISLIFFCFVKNIWDEDTAVIVALFFPFYGTIAYWGLGIFIALAAMYYVKKNTFKRAILFWGVCIWCTIYRLDLGVAFMCACMAAFVIYIIVDKNMVALKQLTLSLAAWGIAGGIVWFGICIAKGINPVYRLLEFVYISASNQNWAYDSIGDTTMSNFAFVYVILPFSSIMVLLYVIFSKRIRENIEKDKWIILLVLGFAYLSNFSRGLVRHSLVENALDICAWSAYVFLSLFVSVRMSNKKLFLPVFTMFILLTTLLKTDVNYSERSIADAAMGKIGTYTETWTIDPLSKENMTTEKGLKTYWEELYENQEKIERVQLAADIKKVVEEYQEVLNGVLADDETFVDMINRTMIYSLINRKDPVYVSQSPLQMSGQFTQERFIEEIEGVPVVLMPCDPSNYGISEALDNVANSYRYYKVFEYIYQNYIPLCKYEDKFAIWCLPDRYDDLRKRVEKLRNEQDIEEKLIASDLLVSSEEKVNNSDGTFNLNCTGADPKAWDLQAYFDIIPFVDKDLKIEIDFESDVLGIMQIFYTSDENENFTGTKVSTYTITENAGTAIFKVPVTKFTRLRFDTPEESNVKIKSFRLISCDVELIEYGYDGPYLQKDGLNYSYLPAIHNYNIDKLPIIWGEGDKRKSYNNSCIAELSLDNGYYMYSLKQNELGTEGNYLKVNITYAGTNQFGKIKNDDEVTTAMIAVGKMEDSNFETKYIYNFTVKEGTHTYIFRISNDYYWYLEATDAIKIESEGQISDVSMEILRGD